MTILGHVCAKCIKKNNGTLANGAHGTYVDECDLCERIDEVYPAEDIVNVRQMMNNYKSNLRDDRIDQILDNENE